MEFFTSFFESILSFFMSILVAIFPTLAGTLNVEGQKLDMSQFELVWEDEFEGNELDTSAWSGHSVWEGHTSVRKGGYWNLNQVSVYDGNLHITPKYYENGYENNGLAGWYSAAIDTSGKFEQAYGYFEVRCILPKGNGLWSAFWLNCSGMYNVDGSGKDGAEIDILESPFGFAETDKERNRISNCVHYDGYGSAHKQKTGYQPYITDNNPYEEYNTYGLEWNKDEYIFYINGVATSRSTFGGASQVPEYMILSVEFSGANGVPGKGWASPSGVGILPDAEVSDFIVDYVRVYQYK